MIALSLNALTAHSQLRTITEQALRDALSASSLRKNRTAASGLPRLPLDPRWVELRLEEEIYLGTKGLDPGRQILEQLDTQRLAGSCSIRALLANTESYLVIGKPGAENRP